jgi:Glyoxalase-like domain
VNDYEPSPSERVRDQVACYEATDGAEGEHRAVRAREIHGAEKDRWWVVAESFRPLGLGASRVRDIEDGGHIRWTTFQDPQGNEFDLIAS